MGEVSGEWGGAISPIYYQSKEVGDETAECGEPGGHEFGADGWIGAGG